MTYEIKLNSPEEAISEVADYLDIPEKQMILCMRLGKIIANAKSIEEVRLAFLMVGVQGYPVGAIYNKIKN